MRRVIQCGSANLQGLVTRRKMTRDKMEKALSILKGALDYSEFKHVDMVIEVGLLLFIHDPSPCFLLKEQATLRSIFDKSIGL